MLRKFKVMCQEVFYEVHIFQVKTSSHQFMELVLETENKKHVISKNV